MQGLGVNRSSAEPAYDFLNAQAAAKIAEEFLAVDGRPAHEEQAGATAANLGRDLFPIVTLVAVFAHHQVAAAYVSELVVEVALAGKKPVVERIGPSAGADSDSLDNGITECENVFCHSPYCFL